MSSNKGGYRIQIDDQSDSIQHQADKTLLESMEAADLDAHFHCRQGFCGACRCKLIAGEIEYKIDPLAFIDDDEILPCCCYPTSDLTIKLG